ncbi:hypothetical protein QVD99_000086 [Batrachochytrium dendrobatidis]|nr:hypothetical protein QVD99_000086 [Batrachochytrium dendrobatidis]
MARRPRFRRRIAEGAPRPRVCHRRSGVRFPSTPFEPSKEVIAIGDWEVKDSDPHRYIRYDISNI